MTISNDTQLGKPWRPQRRSNDFNRRPSNGRRPSNDHQRGPRPERRDSGSRPPRAEVLQSQEIQIERKTFLLERCENHLGQFIRIRESGPMGSNLIVIPADGLAQFKEALNNVS